VVSQADYDAYVQTLKDAGNTGAVGDEYNTNTNLPGTDAREEEVAE
jgi:cytochrome c oxidase subunit II